ncbi:MAG: aspartate/glutamate racemase family protein [Pseudomonadota bacterium]
MPAKAWSDAVHILVINPNSTASMTAAIGEAARAAAAPGTTITAINPETGPPAIQGPEDGAAALPGLFSLFDREVVGREAYDAAIIACFDDTGLMDLRARSPVPVVGIGEAGYLAAARRGKRFSVVTTLAVSVPILEANIAAYGLDHACARVRASGVPVLALEEDLAAAARIEAEIDTALRDDGCDAIVLGCAGMAQFAEQMQAAHGIPVIDGVAAAVAWCEEAVAVKAEENR